MRRLLLLALLLPGVSVLAPVAGAQPAGAQSDESEIESVVVEATVNPDGSMDVVETLAYDFTAERNGGFRSFQPGFGEYVITGFRVTEDGDRRDLAPGFDDPNTGGQVRWFGSGDHSKVSGRHDYELTYTVESAVDVFPDVAVLFWQFIGSDFPQLDEVRIDVTFPEGGEDLRAFAHGALQGVVQPVGNQVALRVVDNPAGQFVEARVLASPSVFSVPPAGAPQEAVILAEEGALADAANAERERLRRQFEDLFREEVAQDPPGDCDGASGELEERCDRLVGLLDDARDLDGELDLAAADLLLDVRAARADVDEEIDRITEERNRAILNVAGPVLAAAGLVGAYANWRRSGKDPERPADIGEYWRDIPPESPAVVASVDDWGAVDSKAMVATIVDLAQRGWLTISEEGKDHRFTRTDKAEGEPLKDYEAGILWRLFPIGRHTVTQDELTEEAKLDRTVSAAWLRSWRAQVKADYDSHGFEARTGCLPWLLHLAIVAVLAVVGVGAIALQAWIGVVALGAAALLLVLTPLLRRRTEHGARKLAEVAGLEKFLEDFSLIDDVPVGHLALYERYLVYAVALGVADRLLAGLRVRFPELANDPSFAPWYGPAYVGAGIGRVGGMDRLASLGSIDAFASDFSRATATAFSPPSSSSGGGGGFSGGGGGGGGGGGAGSW